MYQSAIYYDKFSKMTIWFFISRKQNILLHVQFLWKTKSNTSMFIPTTSSGKSLKPIGKYVGLS